MANIGLFFGSFNPIHLGHLNIAQCMLEQTDFLEIWFVPSPQNPHKPTDILIPADLRLKWVQMAINNHPQLKCCDIEFSLPIPSYSYDTLTELWNQFPQHQFHLIMGSDNIETFHKWKNADLLAAKCPIHVYPRPGVIVEPLVPLHNEIWHHAPMINISATEIREALKTLSADRTPEQDQIIQFIPEPILVEVTAFFQS